MYKYLIIGGGITGASFARLLQMKGIDNYIVLESQQEAGGLCRTKEIQGHQLDLGGGHFLWTKYPEVFDFIFAHMPESEFNLFTRVSKITVDNEIIDFPIESNIWQMSLDNQVDYLLSVMHNGEAMGDPAPTNYKEWILWKLGELIANRYMLPYNEKIWGVKPEEMDLDWLHKIPRLDLKEILKACLTQEQDRSKMPSHSKFYYPKKGGFQEIFDAIYNRVADKFILGQPVNKMEYCDNHWLVNDKYEAEIVINTAPWPYLFDALGQPENMKDDFAKLRYNSIVVALYNEVYDNNWHWIYVPDEDKPYHRRFYINNFAPHSAPNGLYSETNVKRWNDPNLTSDLRDPIYTYQCDVAYPIPVIGHAKAISNILSVYEQKSLYGLGRWGQWQYLNADVCIYNAMQLVDQLENKLK